MMHSDDERTAWLRMIRTDGIGPRMARTLVERFGSAGAALEALPQIAGRAGRAVRIASQDEAERELAEAARLGARFIALGEADYPAPLAAIDTAPPLIAVRGAAAVLARPAVAVVGARNASAAALAFTERLARELGEAGYVVVSGLARGVDTRAHRGSLDTGTIAVLAGGHDRIYPGENAPLVEEIIAAGGAVLSEMPLGREPRARDFPHRNRLVSGLAYGVVVVEAARRSGSLITARCALEQGREVFAVPGSPIDPRAEGTNDLIRSGATLCAAAEHVTSVLAPLIGAGFAPAGAAGRSAREGDATWDFGEEDGGDAAAGNGAAMPHEDPEGAEPGDVSGVIARLLGPTPISIDELARQSGLPVRAVQMTLLELELAGRIERHGGNAVSASPLPKGEGGHF